jgi:GTP-dependent phosphoenolpyruvate carboxykinase
MEIKPVLKALPAHLASEEWEKSRTKAADRLDSCCPIGVEDKFRRNDTLEHSHPLDCARDKRGCEYMCTSWELAGPYEAGQNPAKQNSETAAAFYLRNFI